MPTPVWTIIVAAGSGTRFGGQKLLAPIGGRSVLELAVATAWEESEGVVVVVADGFDEAVTASLASGGCRVVEGAASRSGSVRAGLAAVPSSVDVIVVHDGARPLASRDLYDRVITEVRGGAACAVPVVPVIDTIRSLAGGVVSRENLRAVQTPQAFDASVLRRAHEAAVDASDDSALIEAIGGKVVLVEGSRSNIKITEPVDLDVARALVRP